MNGIRKPYVWKIHFRFFFVLTNFYRIILCQNVYNIVCSGKMSVYIFDILMHFLVWRKIFLQPWKKSFHESESIKFRRDSCQYVRVLNFYSTITRQKIQVQICKKMLNKIKLKSSSLSFLWRLGLAFFDRFILQYKNNARSYLPESGLNFIGPTQKTIKYSKLVSQPLLLWK